MTIQEQIKETKDNCLYIEVDLIGDGTFDNPYQADLPYDVYTHLDSLTADGKSDIDYVNKKVKIYINTIKTSKAELDRIRRDPKIRVIFERRNGKTVS